jgi:hypothetical protein
MVCSAIWYVKSWALLARTLWVDDGSVATAVYQTLAQTGGYLTGTQVITEAVLQRLAAK